MPLYCTDDLVQWLQAIVYSYEELYKSEAGTHFVDRLSKLKWPFFKTILYYYIVMFNVACLQLTFHWLRLNSLDCTLLLFLEYAGTLITTG